MADLIGRSALCSLPLNGSFGPKAKVGLLSLNVRLVYRQAETAPSASGPISAIDFSHTQKTRSPSPESGSFFVWAPGAALWPVGTSLGELPAKLGSAETNRPPF